MTAQRVIPRWSKRSYHAAIVCQKAAHDLQDRRRVVEMFESVDRQDDVSLLIGLGSEDATLCYTMLERSFSGLRQSIFADIDADDFFRAAHCNCNRIFTISAAEVDHHFVFGCIPNLLADKCFNLADAVISTAITITRVSIHTDPPEQC